jgi:hypothetical protein
MAISVKQILAAHKAGEILYGVPAYDKSSGMYDGIPEDLLTAWFEFNEARDRLDAVIKKYDMDDDCMTLSDLTGKLVSCSAPNHERLLRAIKTVYWAAWGVRQLDSWSDQ